jgi:hypothetical protein
VFRLAIVHDTFLALWTYLSLIYRRVINVIAYRAYQNILYSVPRGVRVACPRSIGIVTHGGFLW